jgi:hypothetical protein
VWLQVLAQVEEGSAHELAFSMMLSLALIPAAQQAVADQGEIQQLIQVCASIPPRDKCFFCPSCSGAAAGTDV